MSRHVAWTEGQLREAQGRKNTGGWSVEQRGRGESRGSATMGLATFTAMRRASSKVSTFVLSASRPRIAIGKVVQSERKIRSEGEDDEPLADYQR